MEVGFGFLGFVPPIIFYSDLSRGLKKHHLEPIDLFGGARRKHDFFGPTVFTPVDGTLNWCPRQTRKFMVYCFAGKKHTLQCIWIMTPKKSFSGQKKKHQETMDLKLNEQEVSRRPKVQCTLAIGQGIWSFQAPHLQTQDQLALCHGRASWAFSGSKDSLLRWELYHCVGHPLVQEPSKVVHFRKWGAQLIVQVISLWPLEERRFVPFFPVEKDPGTAQIVIHHRHALPCCRHRSELKSFGTGVFPAVKRVVFHTCSWATSYAWKPKQSICPPNPPPMQLLRW